MKAEVLENYSSQYIESQKTLEVTFAWQGGEPTLLWLNYFKRIVELQKKHAGGRQSGNSGGKNSSHLCIEKSGQTQAIFNLAILFSGLSISTIFGRLFYYPTANPVFSGRPAPGIDETMKSKNCCNLGGFSIV